MAKTIALSQASNAGFHFANLYQCCQRKFFIKWVIRPAAKYISAPLVYGIAFHEAKATFYKTRSVAKAKAKAISQIKHYKTLFEHHRDYEMTLLRVPILIGAWIAKFGYTDLERYELIVVEGDFAQPLPGMPDFVFTGRIDAVVRDKATGLYFILETKTSSSSKDLTLSGVMSGDQVTSYLWLASKQLDVPIAGVIPDIAYWHKSATTEANIDCFRAAALTRDGHEINAFLQGLKQIFSEISQKVAAYRNGYDEDGLFPRNTYYCTSYGKMCEFATICRLQLRRNTMPMGFEIDRRKHELGGMVEDQITES